jgi:hypothetical protein
MTRTLLFLAILGASLGLLVWLAGGIEGPAQQTPRPAVETRPERHEPSTQVPGVIGPDGVAITGKAYKIKHAQTKTLVWVDPLTGERVEIPGFNAWTFEAATFEPLDAGSPEKRAGLFEDVRVRTYRDPATREEALRLKADPAAFQDLLHLEFFADRARADGIAQKQAFGSPDAAARPAFDATIHLTGSVRIDDNDQALTILGEDLTVDPDHGTAEGAGAFVVRHEAYEITGRELSLDRSRHRVTIGEDARLRVFEDVRDAQGRPLLGRSHDDFRPGEVRGRRAVVVRASEGSRDQVTLELEERVHAEQEGGRSLDADRMTVITSRVLAPGSGPGGKSPGWALERLEAEGHVEARYPDVGGDGRPFLASVSAGRLVHEPSTRGLGVTVLDGDPVLTLHGDVPLGGTPTGSGMLRATCRGRAVFAPDPAAAPAGLDPAQIYRLTLNEAARVERRGSGADAFEDVLEGDTVWLLLAAGSERAADGTKSPAVASAFAAEGDVRLSGTRLAGTTRRLVAEALHTETPVLVATGPGTTFHLLGLAKGQRFLGAEAPEARGEPGEAPAPEAATVEPAWVVERLVAASSVEARTMLGGPAVGVPASLAGERVTYDRVSDRAEVTGGSAGPARVHVDAASGARDFLAAPTLVLERGRGVLRALGGVEARIHATGRGGAGPSRGVARAEAQPGRATEMALTTDAPVTVRLARVGTSERPQLGAEQSVRIDGPFTAEMHAGDSVVDRLRAGSLDAAMALRPRPPREARSAAPATARAAAPPAPTRTGPAPVAEAPAPWDVASTELTVEVVAGEVRALSASGRVDVTGPDLRVDGHALDYRADTRTVTVRSGPTGRAQARFGPGGEASQVEATELALTLGEGGAKRLKARGPVDALLLRTDRKQPGRLERFQIACLGDVDVDPGTLTAVRTVRVQRSERPSAAAPWGAPSLLWADAVRATGANLLSNTGMDVARILADGRDAAFQSGEGADLVRTWSRRIDIDVHAGTAELTGEPGRDVEIVTATSHVAQERVVFDFRTGKLKSTEGARVILRGSR